ncbi:MAG: hypothetical protein COV44_07580 [Deltaproteobacteria bacterium CG11_big_fil_rev_8_21_14_0_20_45_16]|nr:MAG: hypothetical protein COV44_07580 [Deltaproteobacteria bacterium CG11_big_fil_rev_8_21_14_0_20_45_16]
MNEKYPAGSTKRWIYTVYLLALNSGLRAGEIWGLKFEDIKQDGEVLHIQRQFDRVHRDFRTTKGKTSRLVPCNENLFQELMALKRTDNQPETIFSDRDNGNPIDHDNFRKRNFEMDLAEWGGKRIRFHDLRHTAATLMIADNLDIKTVQEICGHKDLKTTLNYWHLLGEKIKHAARTFSIKHSTTAPTTKPTLRLIKNG